MLDWVVKVFLESEYFGPTFRSFERTMVIALSFFQCFGTLIAGFELIAIYKGQTALVQKNHGEEDARAVDWYNRQIKPELMNSIRIFREDFQVDGDCPTSAAFDARVAISVNTSGLAKNLQVYVGVQKVMDPNEVTFSLLLSDVAHMNSRVLESNAVSGIVAEIFKKCREAQV
jgi:hypothetical protein